MNLVIEKKKKNKFVPAAAVAVHWCLHPVLVHGLEDGLNRSRYVHS